MAQNLTVKKAKQITKTIFSLASIILLILSIIGVVQTIQKRMKSDALAQAQEEAAQRSRQNQDLRDTLDYFYDDEENKDINKDASDEYGLLEHGLTDKEGVIIFK